MSDERAQHILTNDVVHAKPLGNNISSESRREKSDI
jgi:hypothetical protein